MTSHDTMTSSFTTLTFSLTTLTSSLTMYAGSNGTSVNSAYDEVSETYIQSTYMRPRENWPIDNYMGSRQLELKEEKTYPVCTSYLGVRYSLMFLFHSRHIAGTENISYFSLLKK